MGMIPERYSVAIIGSGMGGSTLASVLARQGLGELSIGGRQKDGFLRLMKQILHFEMRRHRNRLRPPGWWSLA